MVRFLSFAKKLSLLLALGIGVSVSNAQAREEIRIVGSSTVFPFVTTAAEHFGKGGRFKTPIVESTGTGGGFKLFCAGVGMDYVDFVNASRPIKPSEFQECTRNGVSLHEIKIGFDGIVLASTKGGITFKDLTRQQLFLALAFEVPKDGRLVPNPYKRWSEIDPSLPNTPIVVMGPPPTSGTRDAFTELALEAGCAALPQAKELNLQGKACDKLREDGVYVQMGENDNLIVQKLKNDPNSVGIFGYSYLKENTDVIQAAPVEGSEVSNETIISGKYPLSRSLFVYVKINHASEVPGIKDFISELLSPEAIGVDGYIVNQGLIPLPESERLSQVKSAYELYPLVAPTEEGAMSSAPAKTEPVERKK